MNRVFLSGIGRGQMTVLDAHIAHHKHVQALYEELLADVLGVHIHKQPADPRFDANFWLCAATLDPEVRIQGQENAYKDLSHLITLLKQLNSFVNIRI